MKMRLEKWGNIKEKNVLHTHIPNWPNDNLLHWNFVTTRWQKSSESEMDINKVNIVQKRIKIMCTVIKL